MNLSSDGLNFIKQWEAFRSRPYADAGGYLTIGYGHKIRPGESFTALTEPQAAQLLAQDVAWAEDAVNRNVTFPLTQSMFEALVGLVFNWGETNFVSSSKSALQPLNRGDYLTAAAQLAAWPITSGGVRSQGLINRRAAESEMFLRQGLPNGAAAVSSAESQAPAEDESSSLVTPDLFGDGESSLWPLVAVAGGILALVLLLDS